MAAYTKATMTRRTFYVITHKRVNALPPDPQSATSSACAISCSIAVLTLLVGAKTLSYSGGDRQQPRHGVPQHRCGVPGNGPHRRRGALVRARPGGGPGQRQGAAAAGQGAPGPPRARGAALCAPASRALTGYLGLQLAIEAWHLSSHDANFAHHSVCSPRQPLAARIGCAVKPLASSSLHNGLRSDCRVGCWVLSAAWS